MVPRRPVINPKLRFYGFIKTRYVQIRAYASKKTKARRHPVGQIYLLHDAVRR